MSQNRDDGSVAAHVASLRACFWLALGLLTLLKLVLALKLAPFGDEAFYWLESRHPAWGYSDLPPLTAWLIRLGESVLGHGVLAMRAPFLVLGAVVPCGVMMWARRHFGPREGYIAGLLAMALPLLGTLGVLALPDVPLTFAGLLALLAFDRAAQRDRLSDWLWLGVALLLACLSHYRAAMLLLGGLVFCLLSPRGRAQWRRRGFYLALAIGSLGGLVLLCANLRLHGAGIAFQLWQRNPWHFHADALQQPLEQALVCTPVLYVLMWIVAVQAWRRRDDGGPWDIAACSALTLMLGYFIFGLFADDTRFRLHWPLPAYLPLLALLPAWAVGGGAVGKGRWRGRALIAGSALSTLGLVVALAYLGVAAWPQTGTALTGNKAFPDNFAGWRTVATQTRHLLAAPQRRDWLLVADNFMLAAELRFQLSSRRRVYSLDSPLNAKHGRAVQLHVWQLDGDALRAQAAGRSALLVVEETSLRETERPDWLGGLCSRVQNPRLLARLDLFGGRKRFAFYAVRIPSQRSPVGKRDDCLIWRRAYQAYRTALPES